MCAPSSSMGRGRRGDLPQSRPPRTQWGDRPLICAPITWRHHPYVVSVRLIRWALFWHPEASAHPKECKFLGVVVLWILQVASVFPRMKGVIRFAPVARDDTHGVFDYIWSSTPFGHVCGNRKELDGFGQFAKALTLEPASTGNGEGGARRERGEEDWLYAARHTPVTSIRTNAYIVPLAALAWCVLLLVRLLAFLN